MQNSFYLRYGKRLFDIIFSSSAIVILSPVFLVISLMILMSSKGEIFYRQIRIGKDFKPFVLYKFRTMIKDADKIGPLVTKDSDPRITKIGKILRKTKLDELPQFINVLKGDMSIVGPRPEVEKYVNARKEDYKVILSIKPGITDYATILFRDEEDIMAKYENVEESYLNVVLPQKIALYKKYIDEISFRADIKIIAKTMLKVLRVDR